MTRRPLQPAKPGEIERLRQLLRWATPDQRWVIAEMVGRLAPVSEMIAYLERQRH